MKVAVAGGGTAGHIEPALNIADALVARGVEVVALGTTRGLEQQLVPARGYRLREIPPIPLPRKLSFDLLTLPFRLLAAVRQTSAVLLQEGVDVVVGFGGYVALPAYLGARRLGIPVVVHEANARPGLANRIGAVFAATVFDTVAGSLRGAQTVGIPVREAIRQLDREAHRAEALEYFGLDAARPTLLVFGGSQGARRLNDMVVAFAADLIAEGWQVLHSIGMKNEDQRVTDLPHYICVPYIERMDLAYAIADAAVTRAGAMTVAELSSVGVPAVFVPLPIGNGEQTLNAAAMVRAGGGILVDDALCTPAALIEAFAPWRDSAVREQAALSARSIAPAGAADTMVDVIMRIGGAT